MLIKQARNLTITVVSGDGYWGKCYNETSCTGMIGMVNRKEADFAIGMKLIRGSKKLDKFSTIIIGPFSINKNRMQGVEFTIPLLVDFWGLLVPVRQNYSLAAILHAFESKVWMVLLMAIPIYILLMTVANYNYFGQMKWEMFASFVLRACVMERRGIISIPVNKLYQKILVLFWCLPLFVLITAYRGNMTALITKPTLDRPIENVNELVNQDEIGWTMVKGSSMIHSSKRAPSGT